MIFNFFNLNNQLKKIFPQAQIVFGGSQLTDRAEAFSDLDVYLIFRQTSDFLISIKNKDKIFELKKNLDDRVRLHFLPQIFLSWRLYDVRGIFYINHSTEDYVSPGQPDLIKLNSLKLSWKNFILLKLAKSEEDKSKYSHDLQKNFYWLTNQESDDMNFIANSLIKLSSQLKTFLWRDWFFYCLRFKKIFPLNFEAKIIGALVALNNYIENNQVEYQEDFYNNLSCLGKVDKVSDPELMFKQINRYIFLIFVV